VASFENRLANVEASLMVVKWMLGFNPILTVAIVGMLFFVLANESRIAFLGSVHVRLALRCRGLVIASERPPDDLRAVSQSQPHCRHLSEQRPVLRGADGLNEPETVGCVGA
jgi:hypothetical protein